LQRERAENNFKRAQVFLRDVLNPIAEGTGEWSQLAPALRKSFTKQIVEFESGMLNGDPDNLIADFRERLRSKPNDAYLHYSLSCALRDKGLYDESLAAAREAVRLKPKNCLVQRSYGAALRDTGRMEEAIAAFREAIRLKPDDPGAYRQLAGLLEREALDPKLRDPPLAVELATKVLAFDPDACGPKLDLAFALADNGDYAKARELTRESLDVARRTLGPDDPALPAEFAYAACFFGTYGELDEARKLYEESSAWYERILGPHHRGTQLAKTELFKTYAAMGRCEDAVRLAREIVKTFPDSYEAYINVACLLADCPDPAFRNPAQAVELAKNAVELAPTNCYAWNTLGTAQYRMGNHRAAIEALLKSSELRGNAWYGSLDTYFFLAMAYQQVGEQDAAREWYAKAVKGMKELEKVRPTSMDYKDLLRIRTESEELLGLSKRRSDEAKSPIEKHSNHEPLTTSQKAGR
jgi:tetratricopeptide (TPR) repeat protein